MALGVLAAGLGGCGSSSTSASAAAGRPATELSVEYWSHGQEGAPPRVWILTCEPTGGDHPRAGAACAELSGPGALARPAQPCPLVIVRGEPETRVTGVLYGRTVTAIIRPRCGSAWRRLHVLLTGS